MIGLLLAGCGGNESPSSETGLATDGGAGDGGSENNPVTNGGAAIVDDKVILTPENTTITFVGSKPDDSSHEGGFNKGFSGEIAVARLNGEPLGIESISMSIDIDEMWTDNDKLTDHLLSPDFFDARAYPQAEFSAPFIYELGEITITGDLTLHGVTKEISFPATVEIEGESLTLNALMPINRLDFGISYQPENINAEVPVTIRVGTREAPAEPEPICGGPAGMGKGGPGGQSLPPGQAIPLLENTETEEAEDATERGVEPERAENLEESGASTPVPFL